MTDYNDPVESMTLPQVQSELRSYRPGTKHEIDYSLEHAERRAQLWRRLDLLLRYGYGRR